MPPNIRESRQKPLRAGVLRGIDGWTAAEARCDQVPPWRDYGAGPIAVGTALLRVLWRGQDRNRPPAAAASTALSRWTVANRIHERLTDFGPEACGSSMTVALAASP